MNKIFFKGNQRDLNKGGIYSIINLVNKKQYIGSTNNFKKRFRSHNNDLLNQKHGNIYLQRAYNKYGVNSFNFIIKEVCENCLEREQIYLDEIFNMVEYKLYYYNISKNAFCPPSQKGKRLSKEHKEKIRLSQIGILGNNYGKKHSSKTIEKMRKVKLGKKQTSNTKEKIRQAHIGKKHSVATKSKIREQKLGQTYSLITREKMSLSKVGTKHYSYTSDIVAINIKTQERITAHNSRELSEKINVSPSAIDVRLNSYSKRYTQKPIFGVWKIIRDNDA